MKTLQIFVYAHPNTDLEIFKTIIARKSGMDVVYETTEERLVTALTAQRFDLLILDLDLEKGDYKKAQLMTEMIYPGAATTELDLCQGDFTELKLESLMQKWREANDDSGPSFYDNPGFI